ncbi:glycosyl hydrolase [Tunicatimonas pelagia]|uniref:glycosyl hydrolase n=1 Tax=Tunicatimonas pelagia TaxID=931531 RepID=UPI002666165F|nr:glycosyl hydrolase [Tunicatimonas pelagia]WKN44979.1 glycosyl hydrolase [Tunicatimonas pelagia]
MKSSLCLFVLSLALFLKASLSVAQAVPVNPKASKEAKQLLSLLYKTRGERILSGQHNYPHELSVYSDSVVTITGKRPALWGSDFSYKPEAVPHRQKIIDEVIRMHEQGHIITLMYHQVRPQDSEPNGWKESIQNEVTKEEWIDLLTSGTKIHQQWLEKIDTVAYFLKQLQDRQIPVLWRPYHEMNGEWFWWGGKESFAKLWVMLYDRYVHHHQLNNLLWVWNANAPTDSTMAYADYFPGSSYVDVLAADVYHNDYRQSHHDELLELAEGKPIALGECGTAPTPAILSQQPQWAWFMIWTHFLWTHNRPEDIIKLYDDPRVMTLNEVGSLNVPNR